MIALDLPGYGGSDSLERYGATEVLEALTEFIVAVREQYGVDPPNVRKPTRRVIIVAHDWGAVLGFRLAAEAPQLADRFIATNGPLVSIHSNLSSRKGKTPKLTKVNSIRFPW